MSSPLLQGGELEFRFRMYTLFICAVIATLVAWYCPLPDPFLRTTGLWLHSSASRSLCMISLVICLIGIALRAWATGTLKSEDIMDKKLVTNQLRTDGAFAVVRNPLYLGTFVAWASIAPVLNIYGTIAILALLTVRGLRLITYEERELPAKFGQAYIDYQTRVPPLFPRSFGELVSSMMAKPKDQWIYGIKGNAGQLAGQGSGYLLMMIIPSVWIFIICVIIPFIHIYYLTQQGKKAARAKKAAAAANSTTANDAAATTPKSD